MPLVVSMNFCIPAVSQISSYLSFSPSPHHFSLGLGLVFFLIISSSFPA